MDFSLPWVAAEIHQLDDRFALPQLGCDRQDTWVSHKSKAPGLSAYPRLDPQGIRPNMKVADLIDQAFLAYNGGRLRGSGPLIDHPNAAP